MRRVVQCWPMYFDDYDLARRRFLIGMATATAAASLGGPALGRASAPTIYAHGGGQFTSAVAKEIRRLAGGAGARIVISPYAGADPVREAALDRRFLKNMGLRRISVLDIRLPGALDDTAGRRL